MPPKRPITKFELQDLQRSSAVMRAHVGAVGTVASFETPIKKSSKARPPKRNGSLNESTRGLVSGLSSASQYVDDEAVGEGDLTTTEELNSSLDEYESSFIDDAPVVERAHRKRLFSEMDDDEFLSLPGSSRLPALSGDSLELVRGIISKDPLAPIVIDLASDSDDEFLVCK